MSSLRENIAYAVGHLGGHEQVAELLDLAPIEVRKWLLGLSEPSHDQVVALSKLLNIHATLLQYGDLRTVLESETP
jgi:hypothetical protein